MPHHTTGFFKVAGVYQLGLLTGATGALAVIAQPALAALPALTPSPRAFRTVRHEVEKLLFAASVGAESCLLLAWLLSPRWARHPYLLWSGLPLTGALGYDWYLRRREPPRPIGGPGPAEATSEAGSESEEGWEKDMAASRREDVNGEKVRDEIETWGRGLRWRSLAFGLGTLSGLLGLLGDML